MRQAPWPCCPPQVRVPQKTKHGSGGTLQCEVRYEPFPHTTEYKRMMLARRYAENPEEQKGILGVKVDRWVACHVVARWQAKAPLVALERRACFVASGAST